MAPRLELHELLVGIMGEGRVYFQPGPTVQMDYPCIVYKRNDEDTAFADDKPYRSTRQYSVTHIDRNPDSPVLDELSKLPMCVYDRYFAADNLNHDVYNIFF